MVYLIMPWARNTLLYLFKRRGHLILGVCGHEAETNQGIVGSDSRRNDRIDEDALLEGRV